MDSSPHADRDWKGRESKVGDIRVSVRDGHRLMVNLMTRRDPHWRLETKRGRPSLSPSIDVDDGQSRCHFWLRGGRARFTADAVRPRHRRQASAEPRP
jgi:hypothetical protein